MNKFILLIIGFLFVASSLNDARKANEAFKNGDYDLAAQLYRQAIEQNPDDARLYFNLGNALAEAGNTDEAIKVFEQFRNMTEENERQAMAHYNKGKLLSEQENYEEALSHFRDALRKNPNDEDARFNYELAQRKKQKQEQQQQQQDSQSDQDDSEDEQDQENEQNQDENQQQDPNQQPQDQDQPQNQEQLPQPPNMTQEEAENILDALEQLERELLENREKEANVRRQQNDKDW